MSDSTRGIVHRVHDVEVVVTCSCGKCFHDDTEAYAIEEWEQHVIEEGKVQQRQ